MVHIMDSEGNFAELGIDRSKTHAYQKSQNTVIKLIKARVMMKASGVNSTPAPYPKRREKTGLERGLWGWRQMHLKNTLSF